METNPATSIERRYRAVLEFVDKMELVGRFQSKVDVSKTVDDVWHVFLEDLRETVPVSACALYLAGEQKPELMLREVWPREATAACEEEIRRQIDTGMFAWIVNRRQPSVIPRTDAPDGGSVIMLPLATARRTLGLVMGLTPMQGSSVTHEALKLLTILARQCSLVMENTILYEGLAEEHASLKRAQAQILESEKMASIGRLTAGASHEILNPLNIVSGRIQLLLMDEDADSQNRPHLEVMLEQTERINSIIKRLLQFSGNSAPQRTEVKLDGLIEQVLALTRYELELDHIALVKVFESNLPAVHADAKSLFQAIFNLLANAVEAMPEGGELTVAARHVEGPPADGPMVEIAVQDTGGGIAAGDLDKICEPFFTTKEQTGAAGLGLAQAYGVARELGGSLVFDSPAGGGTCARLLLPVSPESH